MENMIAFGSIGQGKTRCFIIPEMIKALKKGKTIIVNDRNKNAIWSTKDIAASYGYKIQTVHVGMKDIIDLSDLDEKEDGSQIMLITQILKVAHDAHFRNCDLSTVTKELSSNNTYELVDEIKDEMFRVDSNARNECNYQSWFGPMEGVIKAFMNNDESYIRTAHKTATEGMKTFMNTIPQISDMQAKTILYVSSNELETMSEEVLQLFYAELLRQATENAQKKKETVFLMDDMETIGAMNDWMTVSGINALKTNNVSIIMTWSSINTIQKKYPDHAWANLLSGMDRLIMFYTTESRTIDFYNEYTGKPIIGLNENKQNHGMMQTGQYAEFNGKRIKVRKKRDFTEMHGYQRGRAAHGSNNVIEAN